MFDESCDPVYALRNPLSHLLYADDLALLSTSPSGLNNCLEKLRIYGEAWKLEVNLKKSEVVIFNPSGRKLSGYDFKFGEIDLKIVQSYCYLGIDLLSSGSFWLTKNNLMEKARKAMFPIFSSVSQFKIPCKSAMQLFHSMIRPITLYNAENWAYLSSHQIETCKRTRSNLLPYLTNSAPDSVLQKFMKFVLGVNRSCTNVATLGELGELPMLIHGFKQLLNFWHRLNNMHEETLARQALDTVVEMGPSKCDWIYSIQYLLSALNLYPHYENPNLVDNEKFSLLCTTNLKELFTKLWLDNINGLDATPNKTIKMRFYNLFKTNFEREPYLDLISDFQLRRTITKFRCSDHILEVERGRHGGLELKDRICKICKLDVETEFHFLKDCPTYRDLQTRYFGNNLVYSDWINILQCKDKQTTFTLINFITKALKTREHLLSDQNI